MGPVGGGAFLGGATTSSENICRGNFAEPGNRHTHSHAITHVRIILTGTYTCVWQCMHTCV